MENIITMDVAVGQDLRIETEAKAAKKTAKIHAVILDLNENGAFDCILIADNKKDLQEKLDALAFPYSIAGIFKGHEVPFRETKKIEFV